MEKPIVHLNKEDNLAMESMFSKSYGPQKNKLGNGYKAALQELK